MAKLLTDIANKVLYFHDMEPVRIESTFQEPLHVSLYCDGIGILLEESYYPGFDGVITLDIREVISTTFSILVPETDTDTAQDNLYNVFTLGYGGDEDAVFTVCGFSKDTMSRITDIDLLRVPRNYRIPLSLCNAWNRSGIRYRFADNSSIDACGLETTASTGIISRMIELENSEAAGVDYFRVELDCGDGVTLYSAHYHVVPGEFEQYLFANRYGGFDNIPMAGARRFIPDMSFESGIFNGESEQVSADADYVYSQDSGFVSRTVMELASELLCSSQVYHLDKNGEFRRIIITESDLSVNSIEHIHSFSFKYKYSDDLRPAALRSKGISNVGRYEPKTIVRPITSSPMKITHGLGKYPTVTIINKEKQVIVAAVEYPDADNITVSWIGSLEGYIYIN